jgi:FkbM family methyltransferase
MNNGDDTAYYLYRGFDVVAIEADPVLVSQAARRFEREIADGRLKVLNVAIAEESGVLPFWVCETNSEWSSFERANASRGGAPHRQIEVQCRRFDSILEEFGVPYYIKIDIEGHDMVCLRNMERDRTSKYLSIEGGGLEALRRLRELGYSHFKCISQYNHLPLELPPCQEEMRYQKLSKLMHDKNIFLRVARRCGAWRPILSRMNGMRHRLEQDRTRNGWSFPPRSSGPFGEDTPGRWQGFDEICETYQHYQRLESQRKPSLFWLDEECSFWADFHARKDG